MSTPVKVGAFVGALAVLFGGAFGVGTHFDDDSSNLDTYSLHLHTLQAVPGSKVSVEFTVLDLKKRVVTQFATRHEKKLHLIAVSTDFREFRHVHPTMDDTGSWTVDLDLDPGNWRLFADFLPAGGKAQVASQDMTVAGVEDRQGVETAVRTVGKVDGYTVRAAGDLVSGTGGTMLDLTVTGPDGSPVTDLQPYLGSYGHLVVLRERDLSYLHVHPEKGPSGPVIQFHVEVPTAGRYHLYLDFKHGGVVRTATFVLDAAAGADDGPAHPHDGSGDMGDMGMNHGDH